MNNKLLNQDLDNMTMKELEKLYNDINKIIKPYEEEKSRIYKRQRYLREQEYLKNRGIKNYPILNNLLNEIGEKYKEPIIDLDEYLGCKGNKYIYLYSKLCNWFEKYNLKSNNNYELYNKISDFLIEHNILLKQYEILCPRCHDDVATFTTDPKSDDFIEKVKKELNEYFEIDEDGNIYCDECGAEINLHDDYNIQPNCFYKINK